MFLKTLTFCALFVNTFATIKDCNTNSLFRPTTLKVSPDPPVPGQPVYLTIIFDNTGPEIIDGTVITTLNINGMPLPIDNKPLCDSTKCPIITGSNDRSTQTTWPQVTGAIKSRVVWADTNNNQLLCIDTSFKVPSSNFWSILDNAKELYHKNKQEIKTLYSSLKSLAEKNNLRGMLDEIFSKETDEKDNPTFFN
jgi:hypothetical protein